MEALSQSLEGSYVRGPFDFKFIFVEPLVKQVKKGREIP